MFLRMIWGRAQCIAYGTNEMIMGLDCFTILKTSERNLIFNRYLFAIADGIGRGGLTLWGNLCK